MEGMTFRLIVSGRADEDISAIVETIASGAGAEIARKYLNRLDRIFDLIAERPEICAPRPRLGRSCARGLFIPIS
jgi:plasmid stabilization system protein ParE